MNRPVNKNVDPRASGGVGNNRASGGVGNNRASGGVGNNRASGGVGNNRASGSVGDKRIYLEGVRKQALEVGRNRLLVTGVIFALAFTAIGGRLINLSISGDASQLRRSHAATVVKGQTLRADIRDRNGMMLATSLPTVSVFANPENIPDARIAAERLVSVLPDLNRAEILARLSSSSKFVWLARNLTPEQHYQVNRLGIPGVNFQRSERRVYPHGVAAAHALGMTDVDGNGLAGVEKYFDDILKAGGDALTLSIDLRIQSVLRDEMVRTVKRFRAKGAAGVVLDARSGETVALVSLPDFDPNHPVSARDGAGFNRVTKGVYEMGSTFKLFTVAMALDSKTVGLKDGYDTSKPIRVSRFTINDYHGKKRWLSVPEILIYSSNIGSAKMAMDVGSKGQRTYLDRFGLLRQAAIQLPEVGSPLVPSRWRDVNTMTISYGHGIAVSPLQLAGGVAALVNGGIRYPLTILKRPDGLAPKGERVVSEDTSKKIRDLMRLVVSRGTGSKAEVPGYRVGGKTGTAEKQNNGGYQEKALISSFVGAFPMDDPKFVILVVVDEPQGDAASSNYATGGWVAAPVVGRLAARLGPMAGIVPEMKDVLAAEQASRLAAVKAGKAAAREMGRATF